MKTRSFTLCTFALLFSTTTMYWSSGWLTSNQLPSMNKQPITGKDPVNAARYEAAESDRVAAVDGDRYNRRIRSLESKIETLDSAIRTLRDQDGHLNSVAFESTGAPDSEDVLDEESIRHPMDEQNLGAEKLAAERMARLEERHATQNVNTDWALSMEDKIGRSLEASQLADGTELDSMNCRSDSCLLDFSQPHTVADTPVDQSELFRWVFDNAGSCEFDIDVPVVGSESQMPTSHRVFLTNCT